MSAELSRARQPAFIDTLDPSYDADIHGAHRAAREHGWYARTPVGILVLDYRDVLAVLRDPRWRELGSDALALAGIKSGALWDWFQQLVSNKEGAEHTRLRRLVSQAFTPRSVDALRPAMRAIAHELIDRVSASGRCEFVSAFAAPYPVRVIGALLGVPAQDFERFQAWSTDLSLAFGARIAEHLPRIEAALQALSGYVDGLIALRRRRPEPDLISSLIAAEERGDRLSPAELSAMITVLIFGDRTRRSASSRVRSRPSPRSPPGGSASRASPAWQPALPKRCCASSRRDGLPADRARELPLPRARDRGRNHRGSLGSGGEPRSEGLRDPDRFDLARRPPEPQLTFGGGVHYCLGASLARAELQEALPILAQRLPQLALDGEIGWRSQTQIRGPERLPLRFEANRGGAREGREP